MVLDLEIKEKKYYFTNLKTAKTLLMVKNTNVAFTIDLTVQNSLPSLEILLNLLIFFSIAATALS